MASSPALLSEAVSASDDCVLGGALEVSGSPALGHDPLAPLGRHGDVRITADLRAGLSGADVLIDFTRPEATLAHLDACVAAGTGIVIGTTGFDDAGKAAIRRASERTGVVFSPNMSVGVNATFKLLEMAAKMMNRNALPGSVVTDKLLVELEREQNSPDKGAGARILRAARMYAIMKGMGFAGVHIGGHNLKYEQVEEIILQGEVLAPQWANLVHYFDYPIPDGFYYFERDPETGLNCEKTTDRQNSPSDAAVECSYGFSKAVHNLLLEPGKNFYSVMKNICSKIEGTKIEGIFHKLEQLTKVVLYDCRDCGDCALIDLAYICPMSQCPKNQRNGACGGSFEGWCEVYPGKKKEIGWFPVSLTQPAIDEELLKKILGI